MEVTDHSSGAEEARSYQIELLEAALEYNTIVLLGTGAGKTFIAVMLIKHMSAPTLLPLTEKEAKRSVFLVNTVPLVTQQSTYIETHTDLSVGKYYGELGVDDWCGSRWDHELATNNILVMTRQIFLDALSHFFLKMSKINLIVFDECHHAVKNDPYVRIMQEFYFKTEPHNRPHILGLSASIISGKCKPGDLLRKIKDVEVNLDCRITTASDLAEIAKYATNPDEVFVSYGSWPNMMSALVSQIKCHITEALNFLDASGQSTNRIKKKDKIEKEIRGILEECVSVLTDVGISSAVEAAELASRELKELMDGSHLNSWEENLVSMALTHIALFVTDCNDALKGELHSDISPKLDKLLKVLDEALRTTNKLCGIVFVQKRTIAACLSSAINKRYMSSNHIRSDFVVGHGAIRKVSVEQQHNSKMNVKRQQQVLKRFKKESINLLIATSVVEEGLDVRKCNLVVRYDFPLTFQSYVQSKGRARSKNSQYLLLVSEEEDALNRSKLKEYTKIESELQKLCHDRSVPSEDEIEEKLKGLYPSFCPLGPEGPRVTINGSISLLHKYCQKLPHDQFTASIPIFKTMKKEDGGICHLDNQWYDLMYTVMITLPMNSPVKEVIQSPALPRVTLAKKAAALEAIKILHGQGELDKHLKPVTHEELDSDNENEEKMDCKRNHHAGTTRRAMYYKNEYASCLHNCQPVADCFLYVFLMNDALNGHNYRSEGGMVNGSIKTMGILSGKPLPYHTIPNFSLYEDHTELVVTIKQLTLSCTTHQLQIYKEFHKALFNRILRIPISDSFVTSDTIRGYTVVPVEAWNNGSAAIDEDLITYVLEHCDNEGKVPCAPFSESQFTNALVSKRYINEIGGRGHIRLYEVLSIDAMTTPLSPFDHDPSLKYTDYFSNKYSFHMQYTNQFSIKCKPISNSEKVLQLVSSRYKDHVESSRQHIPILFPELCRIHPLKADMLFRFRCVPSLIHRFESFLVLNELFISIVVETKLGLFENNVITTVTNVSSKEENYPMNRSNCHFDYFINPTNAILIDTIVENSTRAPDCGLLFKAMTPLSAKDCVNLERLEVLGDSFLKLATSINLFCSRKSQHEGRLSMARERRISNFNLWYLARKKKTLISKIFSRKFEPLSSWIPPGYIFPTTISHSSEIPPGVLSDSEYKYLYHRVPDKGVADSVEALLGACILAGGLEAGFQFLRFIDLKLDTPTEEDHQCIDVRMSSSPSQESLMSVEESNMSPPFINQLLIQNSTIIFPYYCHAPPPSLLIQEDESSLHNLNKLLPTHAQLSSKLGWDFNDKWLLLQALTHPSSVCNNITNSYQRLEFLGDAVLDYLITCYIYETFPDYSPGKITEMRSALVNNVTFADIAIKELELHKHMLHSSPNLFGQISEYVNWLEMVLENDEQEIKSVDVCRSISHESKDAEPSQSTISGCHHSAMSLEDSSVKYEANAANYEEEVEDFEPPKALGDLLESVAGALFLDSNMSLEIVWMKFFPFFRTLIEKYSNHGQLIPAIEELYNKDLPIESVMESNANSGKKYRCTIKVFDKCLQVSAVAKTKKRAKNAAAKRTLEILNHNI